MRAGQRVTGPRRLLPLPAGTAVCLCCGLLDATAGVRAAAVSHTWETGHPAVFRSAIPAVVPGGLTTVDGGRLPPARPRSLDVEPRRWFPPAAP